MNEKELYYVAVKVFLEKEGKLLILKDGFGQWDLPGGRLKKDEFSTPLEDVVTRKLKEELGENIRYTLGKPVVYMRHERKETTSVGDYARIFAVGYEGTFQSGEITLPSHHQEMKWVDIKTFSPEEYFTGGWLDGVREYLHLKKTEV